VSLTNTRSSIGDNVTEDILAIGDSQAFRNGQPRTKYGGSTRKVRRSQERPTDDLEALFEEGLGAPVKGKAKPTSLELHARIETLKGLLAEPDESTVGIWEYFTSNLSAQAWLSDSGVLLPLPEAFKLVTSALLHRLKTYRLELRTADNPPTVTDITSAYASLGLLHPSDWKVFLADLLHKLSELATRDCRDIEFLSERFRQSQRISEDIIGAWKVLCIYYSTKTAQNNPRLGASLQDWNFLHYPHPSDLTPTKDKGGLDDVFLLLWPRCPTAYIGSMTSAALVTFSLMTDAIPKGNKYPSNNDPFIRAIAKLLEAAQCDVNDILESQDAKDPFVKDTNIDWSSVLSRAKAISNSAAHRRLDAQHSVVRPLRLNSTLLSQKVSRAMAARDLKQIDNLWEEAKLFSQRTNTADIASGHDETECPAVNSQAATPSHSKTRDIISQKLYNQFIVSYMEIRQRDRALDVWNYMIEMSQLPTLSNWHAMLEGCRRARDPRSLEAVWIKLRSSALQPNLDCWRTRINGLIDCGKLELAIHALNEMGRDWQEAAKSHHGLKKASGFTGVVKPTIETINDTISALLKSGHYSAAKRILAWGDAFGIKADIVTFNILIRGLIRDGRIQSVPSLLGEMQKQGIHADVATFTTILDEIFKSSGPISSEEQLNLTNLVFAEMEAAGVQPNRFTYNKIVFSLLQTQPKDMKAVQAVLARMAAQKIEPPRDIYTMLIKHLFSQDPPDLEGVRSLLTRIRVSGAILDHIFWDRVIEGYASVSDTANALAVLGRVDKKGSRVGWPALEMVLRALVENKEWEMARQVVRNVKMDRGGPPDINQKGVEGQHSFWRAVGDAGLMDEVFEG